MRLTTSPPSCVESHEIGEPKTPGTLWSTPGLLRDPVTITLLTQFISVQKSEYSASERISSASQYLRIQCYICFPFLLP